MKSEIRNPKSETRSFAAAACPRVPRSRSSVRGSTLVVFLLTLCLFLPVAAADLSQTAAAALRYESGKDVGPLRRLEQAVRDAAADPRHRPAVENALIQLLAPEATFEARRFACVHLAAVGTEACLPAVSELLKHPETVGIACLVLGSHPSPKANDLLLQALAATSGNDRVQIILTLGDRRAAQAVQPLAPLARDPDRNTREAVIGGLGKIASPDALQKLAALRRDADGEIARLATLAALAAADATAGGPQAKASIAIYEELLASSHPLYVRRAALEGLLRADADGGKQRSLTVLRGTDAALKPSALFHVRNIPSADASKVFAGEVSRLTPAERVLLIDALAARNDADARAAIVNQTQAQEETVRQAAVMALAQVGDASVVPVLAQVLASSAPARQQTIEMALASLPGGDSVDQAILRALETGPAAARPGLMNAVARRGAKSAVPVLLTQAASADVAVARAAFRALGRLAEPSALPALLDRLLDLRAAGARGDAENAVMSVLERDPDPDRGTQAVLESLPRAQDVEGRSSLIALLPTGGGNRALAAVKTERTHTHPAIRDAALRAMADWPDASAVDPLLAEAATTTQNHERILALRGAVRLLRQSREATPATLRSQSQKAMDLARNSDEKKLVLSGLAGAQHGYALQLVQPHLEDPAVQAEAAQAAMTLARRLCGAFPEPTKAVLNRIGGLPVEPALKQSAADLLEVMAKFDDFIMGWQVTGPFSAEGKDGQALFDVVFPPEQTGAPGVEWQTMPAGTLPDRPWQLDLATLFGGDHRVAYARAWIHSDTTQPARLEIGSDDGVKAWFNDRVVLAANRGGDVVPGSETGSITLQPGWNSLMLKVTQWTAGWGFCARIAQPDGATLTGLRFSALPPSQLLAEK
jgi:HEAT repeat protein